MLNGRLFSDHGQKERSSHDNVGAMMMLSTLAAAAAGSCVTVIIMSIWQNDWFRSTRQREPRNTDNKKDDNNKKKSEVAFVKLIGKTPLVKLDHLSHLLKRSIYVKMEFLNPGGTGKDRAAWNMIRFAEQVHHSLPPGRNITEPSPTINNIPCHNNSNNDDDNHREDEKAMDETIFAAGRRSETGGIIVEGTSGSTGISLAILSASRGHGCVVVLPDDQAMEKRLILESLGAQVHVVPTASISNPNHYVNVARRIAKRANEIWGYQAVFIDQFENEANFRVHYDETGPEILHACPNLDAFVMSSGTGGTISGVGKYLKEKRTGARIVLVDPPGSSLYHKIEHGVAYAPQQAERRLKRHRYDTLVEGIGLDRVTRNMEMGLEYIDSALRVEDQEAIDMAHWILQYEGLFIGSSSAVNLVGAVLVAKSLPPGSSIVTILCDSGQRHVTRFWNRDFCASSRGMIWPPDSITERVPQCLQNYLAGK